MRSWKVGSYYVTSKYLPHSDIANKLNPGQYIQKTVITEMHNP